MSNEYNIPLIAIKELSVALRSNNEDRILLDSVDFDVFKGEIVGLVGPSGSGKSLIGKSIVRLLNPNVFETLSGEVLFCGEDYCSDLLRLDEPDITKIRGSEIALVYQDASNSFDPSKTIGQQIALLLKKKNRLSKQELNQEAGALLNRVRIDDIPRILKAYPHEISGGQAQRIGIAMALAQAPKMIIADEPTSSLDAVKQSEIIDLLISLNKNEGLSILLISHDSDLIARVCDRVINIDLGKIVAKDKQSIKNRIAQHSGAEMGEDIIMRTEKLTKSYKDNSLFSFGREKKIALESISLKINKNECLGIVGESGSGKSTLGRILARLDTAYDGKVYYGKDNLNEIHGKILDRFRKDVQIVFQNPYDSLNPRMKVEDALLEPLEVYGIEKTKRKLKVSGALRKVGLDDSFLQRLPHQMSGGQCQRVCIARAIIGEPQVLILDECVSSLDEMIKYEIIDLILNLRKEQSLSLVFISHDLDLVRYMADRIMVLKEGEMVLCASTNQIMESTIPYIQQLYSAKR